MNDGLPPVPTRWNGDALADPPPRFRRFATLFGVDVHPDDGDVRRLREGLMRADPDADAFVEWAARQPPGRGREVFERAVERGLDAAPDAPPSLERWLAPLEARPAWLNDDALRLACQTGFRVGPAGGAVLTAMALMGGYRSSAAVKPLAMTGALDKMVIRRIGETSRFVLDVMESGTLPRFSKGWKSACRVRLMHAMVRRGLARRPDWDTAAWGVPINQTDTAATHLEFSAIYLTGLRVIGFRFTRDEREAVMQLWRYVAVLLGADDDILAHDYHAGLRQMYIHGVTNPHADADSRALAQALHELPMRVAEGRWQRAQARLQMQLFTAMSRLALGDEAVDDVGLPPAPLQPVVVAWSAAQLAAETLRQKVPGATRLAARRGRAQQRAIVDELLGAEEVRYVPYGDRPSASTSRAAHA